jgi:hypothetical protein
MGSASTAATPSSTSTARPVRHGGSSASRAGGKTSGRPKTARGIMTLESSPQGPRFRLHAAKREQLRATVKLLIEIYQSLPDGDLSDAAFEAARAIDAVQAELAPVPRLPSDRAENQLPVGDRT